MARIARVVVPGVPHHVTQRGNRRMQTFFSDDDYRAYIDLLAERCEAARMAVWAWCLMPNHVHLVLVPADPDGLRRALGETHRRHAQRVNRREGWRGHLWQERFHSVPMDEAWTMAAARYVELNPVRAGLVRWPEDWPWSSAAGHLDGRGDRLAVASPLPRLAGDWRAFLDAGMADGELAAIRERETTGRPLGAPAFIARLEELAGRPLAPRKRGRKPAAKKG